jgi:hypothetical protein
MRKARKPRAGTRGEKRRKPRSRPTPRWLERSAAVDAFAKRRVMLVLSVLSGAKPVTVAIREAAMTRATYYKLETRALQAMLTALNPLSARPSTRRSELAVAESRVVALEAQVARLQREKRRAERLLLLTRKTLKLPGWRMSDRGLMPRSRWRSLGLKGRMKASVASMPTSDGAGGA